MPKGPRLSRPSSSGGAFQSASDRRPLGALPGGFRKEPREVSSRDHERSCCSSEA
jgi:hypothetical protein